MVGADRQRRVSAAAGRTPAHRRTQSRAFLSEKKGGTRLAGEKLRFFWKEPLKINLYYVILFSTKNIMIF